MTMENLKSIAVGALVGIGIAVIFVAGFVVRDLIDHEGSLIVNTGGSFPLLSEVNALIERHYLREVPDPTELEYASIRGVLSSLSDRNTYFIAPPQTQMESDALAGVYGGVGVKVQRTTEGEFRLTPFDDSPAAAVGIQDGDILLAVNGQSVDNSRSEAETEVQLRGEVKDGAGAEITYRRADVQTTVFVPFGVIQVPSVFYRVLEEDNRLGYVQITDFTNRTPDQFTEAVETLKSQGVEGIIIDLRNNGGGLLQEALEIAGEFVENGELLFERTRYNERSYDDEPGGVLTNLPIAVLVNQYTASASEVVVGAIRDYERGTIIGQRTYGKGTIQQILALSDNSSIHLTYAEWLTPQRTSLDGQGIEPDIALEPSTTGADVELTQAIQTLQAALP
jgi:carboxyl-terminal processing protease